jgi:protein-S-isoprenylcysteine O-methyltransferase Ste14
MSLDSIEQWIRSLGAIAGLATLACAIFGMFKSLRQPSGREERGARFALRVPVLPVATILFAWVGALLWRPLPMQAQSWLRVVLHSVGALLFFSGLAPYLWGMRSLGQMVGPSSGFGVRLEVTHRLAITGPYAHVRHPMYLAVIAAGNGSLLLYRTWAALGFAIIMFGLSARERREESTLAQEFGPQWEAYASQVPPWLPRFRRRRRSGARM